MANYSILNLNCGVIQVRLRLALVTVPISAWLYQHHRFRHCHPFHSEDVYQNEDNPTDLDHHLRFLISHASFWIIFIRSQNDQHQQPVPQSKFRLQLGWSSDSYRLLDSRSTILKINYPQGKGGLDNWPFVGFQWSRVKRSWSICNNYQASRKSVKAFTI